MVKLESSNSTKLTGVPLSNLEFTFNRLSFFKFLNFFSYWLDVNGKQPQLIWDWLNMLNGD